MPFEQEAELNNVSEGRMKSKKRQKHKERRQKLEKELESWD